MPIFMNDNIKTNYIKERQGEPLVLISGTFQDYNRGIIKLIISRIR